MIKTSLSNFFAGLDKVLFLWSGSIFVNIITLLVVRYHFQPTAQPLALHYNVLVGVDWYGDGRNLYLIPLIGFFITVVNYIFYRALRSHLNSLGTLSAGISFVSGVALLGSVLFLTQVN